MIRAVLTLAAAVTLLGTTAAAPVQDPGQWQGMALRSDGRFGMTIVDDEPSEAAAYAALRARCSRNGWPCEIVAVVQDCIATAYSEEDLVFHTAAGPTREQTIAAAYAQCGRAGDACDKDMSACPARR